MSRYHACVWIDHQHARLFWVGRESADVETHSKPGPVHHMHRKADHVGLGTEPTSRDFLHEVAEALKPAKAILITGPGKARTELAGYLNEEFPTVARQIWGIQPMDHPTDGELVAAARRFFRAADKMYA